MSFNYPADESATIIINMNIPVRESPLHFSTRESVMRLNYNVRAIARHSGLVCCTFASRSHGRHIGSSDFKGGCQIKP